MSFSLMRPLSVVPETTVPTPCAKTGETVIVVTPPGQQKSSRTLLSFNLEEEKKILPIPGPLPGQSKYRLSGILLALLPCNWSVETRD